MTDEEGLFGTIEAEITNGEFKGENLEINFGPSPSKTTITMNGDPVAGIKSIQLNCDAERTNNLVTIELYAPLQKIDDGELE